MPNQYKLLVGIDLGTSGIRVVVYDTDGEVRANGACPIHKQVPDAWLEALCTATPIKELKKFSRDEKIISVDSTSGTVMLVDDYGNPFCRPLMYFERAKEEFLKIRELDSAKDLEEKGAEISVTSPLPKILKEKDALDHSSWILSPTTWLLYRLKLGDKERWEDIKTDWTNALKFGEDITVDPPQWYWSIFEDVGVPLEKLPKIVPCGEPIGMGESSLAQQLGLDGLICQGMTDSNAAALGMGCLEPGDFGLSCGTTSVPKFVTSEMKKNPAIYYHKHPLKGYLAGAAPVTAGFFNWFAEKVLETDIPTALDLAYNTPIGEEYMFFPQGDRSPFYDPDMGAALMGIFPEDAPAVEIQGKMLRSIILGISLFESTYISLFENLYNCDIREVRMMGGGSPTKESDIYYQWNALRAAVFEKPVLLMEPRTTMGVIIPALKRLNIVRDTEEIKNKMIRAQYQIPANPKLFEIYSEKKRKFLDRWKKLQRIYH